MKTLAVKYCGSHADYSGYGSANRAFTTALYIAGVDVTTEIVSHVVDKAQFGWQHALARNLEGRKIPYEVKIIHLTPDEFPRYIEKDKYNIAHLFWETDRLPEPWISCINKMDEVWTSGEGMIDVFKQCGVRVPIYAFPQPIDISLADKQMKPFQIYGHKSFLFYSIFQWIDRKNPEGLIKTYWKTFEGNENVSLLLKTYRVNFSETEFNLIQDDIQRWRSELNLRHYPRLLLCKRLLADEDILRLHITGDAYVIADHGEGWNRVLHEALLFGKPSISSARGGIHEHLTSDHYFRVPTTYANVTEQKWIPWYTKNMRWAEPDLNELSKLMQYVYKAKGQAQARGTLAQTFIKDNFSFHKIGNMMRERLQELYDAL